MVEETASPIKTKQRSRARTTNITKTTSKAGTMPNANTPEVTVSPPPENIPPATTLPNTNTLEGNPPEENVIVPVDLVSRLLFVSDEEALQYGDENLGVLWKETFPTDTCPTDRYKIVEELRKVHPRGNLKKNDELFRVVNKKRKMEECFQNVQNLYTDNANISNSLVDVVDESCLISSQNLKSPVLTVPLKKFKNEIIIETTKGVCDELVTQTKKNLKVEDKLNNIKNEIEALKKKNGDLKNEIEALRKQNGEEIEALKKQNGEEIEAVKKQNGEEIEALKNRTMKLEGEVRVLKTESNDRLVADICQSMTKVVKTMKIILTAEESRKLQESFYYNLNRLAKERNLTPNDLKMFKQFKQYFPLENKQDMSEEGFINHVSSLFKSLD